MSAETIPNWEIADPFIRAAYRQAILDRSHALVCIKEIAAEKEQLKRENIALRAALVKIAKYDEAADVFKTADDMKRIARAAVPDWWKE